MYNFLDRIMKAIRDAKEKCGTKKPKGKPKSESKVFKIIVTPRVVWDEMILGPYDGK
jgi:hypothetical protein